jgi:hypothetical protein
VKFTHLGYGVLENDIRTLLLYYYYYYSIADILLPLLMSLGSYLIFQNPWVLLASVLWPTVVSKYAACSCHMPWYSAGTEPLNKDAHPETNRFEMTGKKWFKTQH